MPTMNRLRQIRQEYGMTLEQLGTKVGRSKQYMSELERGNIRLTYKMAVDIAMAFGTTPDTLFLPAESGKPNHRNSRTQ